MTWLERNATVLGVVAESQRAGVFGALLLTLVGALGCQDSFSADGGDGSNAISRDGLALWLRADRGVVAESGRVTLWADQSGSAADAVATETAARPTLVAGGLGGKPVVQFDGVDDALTMPSGFEDFSEGVSVFALTTVSAHDDCRAILEFSSGSEIEDVHLGRHAGLVHYEVLDTVFQGEEYPAEVPTLAGAIHRTTEDVELRVNGSVVGEGFVPMPATLVRTENFVGRTLYAGCPTFTGQIAEILVYRRAVEARELVAIEKYLSSKWGCCSE